MRVKWGKRHTTVPLKPIAQKISYLLHLVTAADNFQKVFVTIANHFLSRAGLVKLVITLTKEGCLAAKNNSRLVEVRRGRYTVAIQQHSLASKLNLN